MTSWNDNNLRAIAETKDLFVYPFREDGTTYGAPTRVWPLVVAGDVYVRAANGQQSSWYQAAGGGRRDGFGLVAREGTQRTARAGAAEDFTLHDPPPGYHPPPPRMSLKEQQRKMRQDWVLEHILVVILIPSVVAIAVIIVLMIAGYR